MPVHRKNKAPRVGSQSSTEAWFDKNKKRQRNRRDMAKASRKKNRK